MSSYRNTVVVLDRSGNTVQQTRAVLSIASIQGQNHDVILQVGDDGAASVHLDDPLFDGHWNIGATLESQSYGDIPEIVIAEGVLVAVFHDGVEYALPGSALRAFPATTEKLEKLENLDRKLVALDGTHVVLSRLAHFGPPTRIELDFYPPHVREVPQETFIEYLRSLDNTCGYMLFDGVRVVHRCGGVSMPVLAGLTNTVVWRMHATDQCVVIGEGNSLHVVTRAEPLETRTIQVLHGGLHSASGAGCCVDSVEDADGDEMVTRYDGRTGQKKSIALGPFGWSPEAGFHHIPGHLLSLDQQVLFDDGDSLTSVSVPHTQGHCF